MKNYVQSFVKINSIVLFLSRSHTQTKTNIFFLLSVSKRISLAYTINYDQPDSHRLLDVQYSSRVVIINDTVIMHRSRYTRKEGWYITRRRLVAASLSPTHFPTSCTLPWYRCVILTANSQALPLLSWIASDKCLLLYF